MSVEVMAWVMNHSPVEGTDRLVLLIIADSADSDGTNAWPSIATIAHRTRLSERTVQRSIGRLTDAGALTVDHQRGGTLEWRDDRRPNRYAVVMRPALIDEGRGDTGDTPQAPDGVTPVSPRDEGRGDTGDVHGVTRLCHPTHPVTHPLVETSNEVSTRRPAETGKSVGRRERPPDPLFDALADVCEIDPAELTPTARGALNRALKDLRTVGATPGQVHDRAVAYRRQWPTVSLTPTALARHWAECVPRAGPLDQRQAEIARVQAWAQSIDREVS